MYTENQAEANSLALAAAPLLHPLSTQHTRTQPPFLPTCSPLLLLLLLHAK